MREMGGGDVVGWLVVIYSIVRKGHKIKAKEANVDYSSTIIISKKITKRQACSEYGTC